MNKVITEGIVLTPPAFGGGLDVWSSADGLAGDPTYDGATNAGLIAADADFGTCLELVKTQSLQKLRALYEAPMATGCYLRVRARVKAISGALPSVRIGAWAGQSGGAHLTGVVEIGAAKQLTTYGEVVEVSAIVGSGSRTGVDMVWGRAATLGHFGLDLTGNTGGVIRVEGIIVEDVTSVFQSSLLDVVDVKDFGAVGDGVTDDTAAFEAADQAANGRDVLVSDGTFYLAQTVTFASRVRFQGTLVMPDAAILQVTQNYSYGTYLDAFGNETLAFKKAFQALLNFTDHDTLDLDGYNIALEEPIDLHAAVGNKNTFASRRVVCNGQFEAKSNASWDDDVVTSSASYSASDPNVLTGVANIASIPVGALVEGAGVGLEIYVRAVDVSSGTITLSNPLWGAAASQTYTFTRFKYLMDFSGFTRIARFTFDNVDFNGRSLASAVMIAPNGLIYHFKDCFFSNNKDRCITSIGSGCSGMLIDRCQFLSDEQALDVGDRKSIGFNCNANDIKCRNNRAVRYKHFGVIGGTGNIITGNHFFQGDNAGVGERTAGMIFTIANCKNTFQGNYVDNCFLQWTNEYDPTPDLITGFSFGSFTLTGNIFFSTGVDKWFRFIQIKPFGTNHYLNGFTVANNLFKAVNGPSLDRVETVDMTYAGLDHTRTRNLTVTGNVYHSVSDRMENPVTVSVSRSSANQSWGNDVSGSLPFGGRTKIVTAIVPDGQMLDATNNGVFDQPYASVGQGSNGSEFNVTWSKPVKGRVQVTVRSDTPN